MPGKTFCDTNATVQVQAASETAASKEAALLKEKAALESRLQDNIQACAALESKVGC